MNKKLLILGMTSALILYSSLWFYLDHHKDSSNGGYFKDQDSSVAIFFLDVGQGDATLIISSDHKVTLIDTGRAPFIPGYGWDSAWSVLIPLFQALGIHQINHLILSHHDIDHMGGVFTLMDHMKIEHLYHNGYIHRSYAYHEFDAHVKEKTVNVLSAGDKIKIGHNLFVQVLSPSESVSFDKNDLSLVLRVTYKELEVILPGDIEAQAEKEICLRYGKGLGSDLLKIPHHGSATSSSYPFIRLVHPQVVIASSGRSNPFGHPSQQILRRYEKLNSHIFRTDQDGHILFVSNGVEGFFVTESGRKLMIDL